MGGQAAKQRRKLERLAQQQQQQQQAVVDTNKQGKRPTKVPPTKRKGKPTKFSKPEPKHPASKKNGRTNNKGSAPKATKKKEKSFQKPKHLKRKLHQAVDTETKEAISSQLDELHRKKKLFSKQQQQPTRSDLKVAKPTVAVDFTRKEFKKQTLTGAPNNNKDSNVPQSKQEATSALKTTTTTGASTPPILSEEEEHSSSHHEPSTKKSSTRTDSNEDSEAPKEEETTVPSPTRTKPADSKDDDDDSEASEEEEAPMMKRQRGKRRRGRKDTESQLQEEEEAKKEENEKEEEKKNAVVKEDTTTTSRRNDNNVGDSRRCIGRKPVTDYEIGKRYEGKVVYIKPFGVFIDIMCHSEAFCHVSRIQDGYVESPHDILKEGDVVQARVVEIDRRLKRITVSLQSDARMQDELKSVQARQQRADKRKQRNKKTATTSMNGHSYTNKREPGNVEKATTSTPAVHDDPTINTHKSEPTTETSTTNTLVDANGNYLKPESEMTPAELKRARKLARRAQRRAAAVTE